MKRDLPGRVRAVARGGEAVVETEQGLVFAPSGLPGEEVRLASVERRGKVLRGEIRAVVAASADRVAPPCPIADRCGGCPLMHARLDLQRALKRGFVAEAVARGAPLPGVEVELVAAEGDGLLWRRRARLAWEPRGGRATIGYHGFRSRRLVPVERCAVLDGPAAAGLQLARDELAPLLAGTGEIAIAVGRGGAPVLRLSTEAPQPPALYRALEQAAGAGRIAGATLAAAGAGAATIGDPREHVSHPDGAPLVIAVGGFAQSNDAMNRQLVARVVALAAPAGARLLELHAGSGNLTVALARDAAELTAVESEPAAAAACRENLAARGLSAKVREARAEDPARGDRVDVVVLDPPRTGAREAIEGIAARRPQRIVYVSCDTATLGRDLGELAGRGYAVDAAVALDMFPHTAEVESIVRLVLAAPDRGR